jgi:hypothetical protein
MYIIFTIISISSRTKLSGPGHAVKSKQVGEPHLHHHFHFVTSMPTVFSIFRKPLNAAENAVFLEMDNNNPRSADIRLC